MPDINVLKSKFIFTIKTYKFEFKSTWDDFVDDVKTPTFLFKRDFIEYHKTRFQDFSLMIYKETTLVALFPANIDRQILYSHQGLTYGGMLTKDVSFSDALLIFNLIKKFCKQQNIIQLVIKTIPSFYHILPSNEASFIFFNANGKVIKRDKVFAIDYSNDFLFHKTKLKHYTKGINLGLTIKEGQFNEFWNELLVPMLHKKYNSKPVHSFDEIIYLKNIFPKNIKQFNVYLKEELLAGITIFENSTVIKSQYAATSLSGERNRALDFLFISIIKHYKALGKKYFSMGTVADKSDLGYNLGFVKQKEELGSRIYIQDHYLISI